MTASFNPVTNPAFRIYDPEKQAVPFVLNSPHSGRIYPTEFLEQTSLSKISIRKSEDYLVDELVMNGVTAGIPLLAANFPRAFLDVNREPFELDPSMFTGGMPDYANTRSVRVAGGLGTIAKIVAEGEEIYTNKLSVEEGLERIEAIYKPYHAALRQLLARTHVMFGYAVLIDCHSMPSVRNGPVGDFRPDFVIGDRYASSCSPEITHYAVQCIAGSRISGGNQQALCRRIYHGALRKTAKRAARNSDRNQPQSLHGRIAYCQVSEF